MTPMSELIEKFERDVCVFIRKTDGIKFNTAQYDIKNPVVDDYNIMLSITGLGTRQINAFLRGGEVGFNLKTIKAPVNVDIDIGPLMDIINNLNIGVMRLYLSQTPEDIAKQKAREMQMISDYDTTNGTLAPTEPAPATPRDKKRGGLWATPH